ncbi:MAG: FAD-dependent oxidoreductase [Rhodobacteraceae bacterium]|nr:FAD-dependent oxidoreductase [Alphaproteobacteria bacterium]NNK65633.1 FAD-dependent oxidoreductase [Paracoccaceae bacterium]
MSTLPSTARVVIIGGGAVGTSSLYHLAKAGWTDCLLLEKNELTAGSTWHAAGNVPTFSASWSIMNMQRYSTELYRGLGDAVDYPMNYHVTGSIRLAHSRERMQEFERARGMGRAQGMDLSILAPKELPDLYPFIEIHDLEGALFDPNDGDIDPAQLTQALAKGARAMGAKIERFCDVIGVDRDNGEWVIKTSKGEVRAEYVVNAAGYYAQRVGDMFIPFGGRQVPMAVMSHQYLLFEEIEDVRALSEALGRKLPLLRDVDSSYYLRQEKNGFNLGPYERKGRAHWSTPDDPMPDDFSFQLYADDLERIEWYVEDAMSRVPILARAGLSKIINGPIPYTPDGNPLIGPMPGVPNAFEACVFTFGIAQGGGAGKVLAEWITEGATEWDMWSCDPRRFTDYTDPEYCRLKALEVYGHEYAMHFPTHRWPAAPDRKLSPVHDRVKALGGQMGVYNGWERADWFAQDGDDTSEEATETWNRAGPWEPRVRAECEAVRDGVGVLDLPGFSRFLLVGDGAEEWLLSKIAGGLPKIGRMGLAYFPDHRGRIVTEMSILRWDEHTINLITAASAQWHDFEWLKQDLPSHLSLEDFTEETSTLIVTGPKSRELLSQISDADLTLPWLSLQTMRKVAGHEAYLARVSFAGELGWEIHANVGHIPLMYDAILAAGAKPFGMWALNSLRLEKGYRTWKGDLSTDYSLIEAGLTRFIDFDKNVDFPGRAALKAEAEAGPAKIAVGLEVDAGEADAPYMALLWNNGELVGETTSGAWGYRVGKSLAIGMLRSELATPGTEIEIDIFGDMRKATVRDMPFWDPNNERLRA